MKTKEENHIVDYDYDLGTDGKNTGQKPSQNEIETFSKELDRLNRETTPIQRERNHTLEKRHDSENTKILVETNITPEKKRPHDSSHPEIENKTEERIIPKLPIFDASAKVVPTEHLESISEYEEILFPEKVNHQDEDAVDITFSFELSREMSEVESVSENERILSQESIQEKLLLRPEEEFDVPVPNALIRFFIWLKRKAQIVEATYIKMRSPDYTLDTFFANNCVFFKGKLKITKTFFFIFLMLIGIMIYFTVDSSVLNIHSLNNVFRKQVHFRESSMTKKKIL
jgi:hypothetical protein